MLRLDQLIKAPDHARYAAKSAGRDRVVRHQPPPLVEAAHG